MTSIQLGTVSHGTMRPQDLIPAFLSAVGEYCPTEYEQLLANNSTIPAYVMDEGDESEWWHSEEAGHLLENLFDLLDEIAPPYCYFGAHEGDGSDYGFWVCWECVNYGLECGEIREIFDLTAGIEVFDEIGESYDYYLLDGKVLYERIDGKMKEHWAV